MSLNLTLLWVTLSFVVVGALVLLVSRPLHFF